MKRIIVFMRKYKDGSFSIENDIFEHVISESNIQLFLAKKEEEFLVNDIKTFPKAPEYAIRSKCSLISILDLEE